MNPSIFESTRRFLSPLDFDIQSVQSANRTSVFSQHPTATVVSDECCYSKRHTLAKADAMKVLIVQNELRLTDSLAKGLQVEGFVVVVVGTGGDGLRRVTEQKFDAAILDIKLPDMSGYEMLQQMRARGARTPVLMLATKDGEHDQVKAFAMGADDYLTKPFSFTILVARLHALIRRGAPERPAVLTAGTLSLDPARRIVERGSTIIDLTPREYGLLEFLMRHRDTAVTKMDILQNVWDSDRPVRSNTVEIYIGYLRRKIDTPFGTSSIQTLRGVGYRLNSCTFATNR